MALAPSFDTVGWFARDPGTMVTVGAAFGLAPSGLGAPRLALPVDAWTRCDGATIAAVGPTLAALEAAYGPAVPVKLADEGLDAWREVFRVAQAGEVWQVHGAWVSANTPGFGPCVADLFAMAEGIEVGAFAEALAAKGEIAERMRGLVSGPTVLVMPTSPGPAPKRDADAASLDGYRIRALEILCPAGLAGLPQYSIPAGQVDDGPVGLSLVGPVGSDADLLEMVAVLA
ncbi:MAG: amidase family protein, partial [Pseudomonadota bacterium]